MTEFLPEIDTEFIEDNSFMSPELVKEHFDMVTAPMFPWYFHGGTVNYVDDGNQTLHSDQTPDDIMFVHTLYRDYQPISNYFEKGMQPFWEFCKKYGIGVRSILRAKLNLTVATENNLPTPAHVDFPHPQNVFLYYYNDSDGETIFYEEKFTGEDLDMLHEERRVKPEAGKAILFDGLRYHSPSPPKDSRVRVVLNVVFL